MKKYWEWLLNHIRFKHYVRAGIVCVLSIGAFICHQIFKLQIDANIAIQVCMLFLTVASFFGEIGIIKGFENELPDQYKQLPDRYPKRALHYIDGSFFLWFITTMIFLFVDWWDSFCILLFYMVFFLVWKIWKLQGEKKLSSESVIDEISTYYKKSKIYDKYNDLIYMLNRHLCTETLQTDNAKLFLILFLIYLEARYKEVYSGFEKNDSSVYEKIYDLTYDSLLRFRMNVSNDDAFRLFLIQLIRDFDANLKEKNEEKWSGDYKNLTVFAAIVSFLLIEKNKDFSQDDTYGRLYHCMKKNSIELSNICMLCFEFLFQYDESRYRIKMNLNKEKLRFYDNDIVISNYVERKFYDFLWHIWVKRENYSLSHSVLAFWQLIRFCCSESREEYHLTHRTQCLYILIKDNKG